MRTRQVIFNGENSERTKFANQLQTRTNAPSEAKKKSMQVSDALPERWVTPLD
jgi:hypothetical protein